MPLSYAQYAGNGSTTTFSVPFPYILKAHVKVYLGFNILNGTYTSELVDGTGFTWTSGTQIQCTTAPAVGQALTVIRQTPSSSRLVDWNDGSNLIAADLDTADLQNLYVVQEQQDRNDSGITQSTAATAAATAATTAANTATSTANTALSTANTALTNANAAVSTANTASTNASAAVSTANTASTNASAAVTTANAASSTANTASTNASNAVTTANAAAANASTALSTANTALSTANAATSTANTASSNASAAVTTANTASTNASNAVTTANTASTNASAAVSTANTASTNATTAVNTANTANNKADQAIAAVSNSINYQLKANVAAIPASPANDTYIEVQDSTGLESFTPLAGMPAGFVGDSGLSVRLRYTSAGSTWNWLNYYANNSDSRYLKLTGGTLTGQIKADDSTSAATPGYAFDGDPNTGVGRPGADELALITGGTARLTIDSAGNVAVAGALTKGGSNVVTVGDSGTVTSAMLADGTIVNADINAAAAIDKTKISGTAITAADTGTVTSTMIADGAILNADVNAAAAIAGTKISPDFGSQNVTTTGTVTGASLIPSSSTAPTNGVYLPAANSVGISTNSAERLRIDSLGRLGIGTASPGSYLSGADNLVISNASADSGLTINSGTASIGRVLFADGTTGNQTYRGYVAYLHSTDTLLLGAAGADRITIDSSGRVGVGTSSPTEVLTVSKAESANTFPFHIENTQNWGWGVGLKLRQKLASGASVTDSAAIVSDWDGDNNSTLEFYTVTSGSLTEKVRITPSGRVGIGTSSPDTSLHVNSGAASRAGNFVSTDATAYSPTSYSANHRLLIRGGNATGAYNGISFTNASNSEGFIGFVQNASGYGDFVVQSYAGSYGEKLRVTSAGNVGIGTTTPDTLTHLYSSTAKTTVGESDIIRLAGQSTDNTVGARLEIGFNYAASSRKNFATIGYITTDTTSFCKGDLYFATRNVTTDTAPTERARIDSSGRLLVGTSSTSSSALLQVQGNSSSSTGDAIIQLRRGENNVSIINGESLGSIQFSNSESTVSAVIEAVADANWNTTNDYPSRLVFSTTADGASSPTERLRIANNGQLSAVIPGNSTLYPGFMARAWVNFNGTGTVAIRANGNVSSITDNGTGDYTVNFTTAMPDANYAVTFGGNLGTSNWAWALNAPYGTAPAAGSIRMFTGWSSFTDFEYIFLAVFR